uniref:UPAR/Ly6 domain-containing protein n=1 Tax=Sphenodon punctatus TaxID=8508 RepID=A0A8D0H0W8_SPHPU
MGKILILCTLVFACVGVGWCVQCLRCPFTVFDIPCHTTTITCHEGQVCATVRGRAAGHKLIKKRSCVDQEKCGHNETASFIGISYTTTYECCKGDFCNSASPALPGALFALPLALASLALLL